MPTLNHFGVGCIPWSPLARGYVTRPLKEQTQRGRTDRCACCSCLSPGEILLTTWWLNDTYRLIGGYDSPANQEVRKRYMSMIFTYLGALLTALRQG